MIITLKNEYGTFELDGGKNLFAAAGLGLPSKNTETVTYEGQPGQVTLSAIDDKRTITLSFDIWGGVSEAERLLKIIYRPVNIIIGQGIKRRMTYGRCLNPDEIVRQIREKLYTVTLQFECDSPYFTDEKENVSSVMQRENMLPNAEENSELKIQLPVVATVRTNEKIVRINGDIPVYPIIEIYCKSTQIYESNGIIITGDSSTITLDYTMSEGETVTVDLPRRKITSSINGLITSYISNDTVLSDFKLVPGNNTVSVQNLNILSEISVTLKYQNNYVLGAII